MTTNIQNFGTAIVAEFDEPEHVAYDDLKPLGTYRGRRSFATLPDARELEIGAPIAAWEQGNPPAPNEVWIDRIVSTPHPTSPRQRPPIRSLEIIRGRVVEPGMFARLIAADEAWNARRAEDAARAGAHHRVDAADLLPALDRVPEQAIGLGGLGASQVAPASKSARMVTVGGRGPVRGIEAIADWLTARGVRLSVEEGQLDYTVRRMDDGMAAVLEVFGPLLAGHVAGRPVPCTYGHREPVPAYTVTAATRRPICAQHLEELEQ